MLNPFLEQTVIQHGFAIMSTPKTESEPGFSYTIGLSRHKQPELIVYGLPENMATNFICQMVGRLKQGQLGMDDGELVPMLTQFPLMLKKAHLPSAKIALPLAVEYAAVYHLEFRGAAQLVLCDDKGLFPWEDQFNPIMHNMQKPLWRDIAAELELLHQKGVFAQQTSEFSQTGPGILH